MSDPCPACGRRTEGFVVPHDPATCVRRHAENRVAEDVRGPPIVLPKVGARGRDDALREVGL